MADGSAQREYTELTRRTADKRAIFRDIHVAAGLSRGALRSRGAVRIRGLADDFPALRDIRLRLMTAMRTELADRSAQRP